MKDHNEMHVREFDAAVLPELSCDLRTISAAMQWVRLYTADETIRTLACRCRLPAPQEDHLVPVARVRMENRGSVSAPLWIVESCKARQQSRAFSYVSSAACVIDGEVDRLRALVDSMRNDYLRDFVVRALSMEESFRWYWTCPASIRNHHCGSGGLVRHSREVAEQAAAMMKPGSIGRDYAIVAGLLHDFGKLWSYENGHLTCEADALGHEFVGLKRLRPLLEWLDESWPQGGNVMEALLCGSWKQATGGLLYTVGDAVRLQDRLSAQNDGETGLGSRHRKPAVIHRLGSEHRRVRGRAAS